MKQSHLILLLVILLSSCSTYRLKKADKLYQQGKYATAGELYRKLYAQTKRHNKIKKGYLAFQTGECFREINYISRSLTGYRHALRLAYPDSLLLFRLAQILQTHGLYDEAALYYTEYLALYPEDLLAQTGLEGCCLAKEWIKEPEQCYITPLTSINSGRSDYAAQFDPSDNTRLYFLSTRVLNKSDKSDPVTGQPFPHLYSSNRNKQGVWEKPFPEEDFFSPTDIPGSFTFSKNAYTLYYTLYESQKKKKREATIFQTNRSGSLKRKKSSPVNPRQEAVQMLHPSISPDGMYLYFASDRPGGYGGTDIYRAFLFRDSIGGWQNLGPEINTPGNELYPSWKDKETFYFSSDGHPGMGGIDIFKAVLQKDSSWIISNPGYPLNSSGNDFGIIFEGEEKGIFSSTRNDLRGYPNLYSFEWNPVPIKVVGYIMDMQEKSIPYSNIRIVSEKGINQVYRSDINGFYSIPLEKATGYIMMASASGYLNQPVSFRTDSTEKEETYRINFNLIRPEIPLMEESIEYEFNAFILQPSFLNILDQLILKLQEYPYLTLRIKGHADRYGEDDYNHLLSEKRAESVKNYLVKNGIARDRIVTEGAGKNEPKEINSEEAKRYPFLKIGDKLTAAFIESLSEEEQAIADQLNRRTEFYIEGTDYHLF